MLSVRPGLCDGARPGNGPVESPRPGPGSLDDAFALAGLAARLARTEGASVSWLETRLQLPVRDTLAQLAQLGLIRLDGDAVVVIDRRGLRLLAHRSLSKAVAAGGGKSDGGH